MAARFGNKNARGVVLDDALLDALRKKVESDGETAVLSAAGVARGTFSRAIAGLTVRESTAKKLRAVLTKK